MSTNPSSTSFTPSSRPDHHLVLDWDGEDDPDNPRNFSLTRRICSTIAVTFLAFVSTLAASIYSPAISEISILFNVSEEVSTLPLSLYNLGLAFGPLIGAPLSEIYGRKAVFVLTTPVFALFVLGAGCANSIAGLTICRFFAGVFAAPAISNASATITDFTKSRYRGVSLAIYYSVPSCGAVLGPLVGGYVVIGKGWRWTQWVTLMFISAAYIPVLLTRETYKTRLLQQRAKMLGSQRPPAPRHSAFQAIVHFSRTLLIRPIHMLLTEPIVTLVCIYSGFLFGLTYTFVVASPWVWQHYYAFRPAAQALSFLSLGIGIILAPIPLLLADHYIYQRRLSLHPATQPFPPEHRLYAALPASLLLPLALLIYAWTSRPEIPWILPMLAQSVAILCSIMVYAPVNLYMLDAYGPLYGASASGAAMLSRYTFCFAFPLFSLRMFEALGVGWATSVLAFCTLGMAPIPWLFWRYGAGLRARGRYEMSS